LLSVSSSLSSIDEESKMLSNINGYIKYVKSTHDDDTVDRLNYVYTIYILLGFAVTLFMKNYVGEPIQCWTPAQWNGIWEKFSESYCFVENTYFVPMNTSLPSSPVVRQNKEMIYYQWVPFALSAMALAFYIPRGVWKILSINSGLTLGEIMSSARKDAKKKKAEETSDALRVAFEHCVYEPTSATADHRTYLSNVYLTMKILEVVNVLGQLLLINLWLGTDYTFWGFGILRDMLSGRQWQHSGHFPRVAYCDLSVREMGNINNWTVQCVLMVNMFNEKIFIFLWFWFAIVSVLSIYSLFKWIYRLLNDNNHQSYLEDLLAEMPSNAQDREIFYRKHLNRDGILLLRLVDENCGRIVASDIAQKMFKPSPSDAGSPTSE
ncbi:hypothetical protein PFISCL1PPCAC_20199, partial [Pristionchus fissidentatus]